MSCNAIATAVAQVVDLHEYLSQEDAMIGITAYLVNAGWAVTAYPPTGIFARRGSENIDLSYANGYIRITRGNLSDDKKQELVDKIAGILAEVAGFYMQMGVMEQVEKLGQVTGSTWAGNSLVINLNI